MTGHVARLRHRAAILLEGAGARKGESRMEFGLFNLTPQRDPAQPPAALIAGVIEQVKLAEALGFGVAWFAEHHFSNLSLSPSPLLTAAHCAGVTRRIRLGTGVAVLPLYQPMRLAEEIAYVDIVSGGRLVLGIGSGSQNHENRGLGTDIAEAHERFREVLDILEMAFRDGRVAYEGRHFRIPPTPLSLRPLQQPAPPVWLAGMSADPAIARRIGERGYTPFVSAQWMPVEAVLAKRRDYEAGWRAAGRDPRTMPFAVQRIVYVADGRADALDAAEHARYTQRVVTSLKGRAPEFDGHVVRERPLPQEQSPEEILAAAMIGDAERVAGMIAEDIGRLGVSHFSCFMQFGGIDTKRAMRSLERFGRDVIPLLDRRFGDLRALNAPERAAAAE